MVHSREVPSNLREIPMFLLFFPLSSVFQQTYFGLDVGLYFQFDFYLVFVYFMFPPDYVVIVQCLLSGKMDLIFLLEKCHFLQ